MDAALCAGVRDQRRREGEEAAADGTRVPVDAVDCQMVAGIIQVIL